MFVISNLLSAIAQLLDFVITIYVWIIIARVLISWVNPDPNNPIVQFLLRVTNPALRRLRQYVPMVAGFDFSPIILIIGLYFVETFVVRTLQDFAYALR